MYACNAINMKQDQQYLPDELAGIRFWTAQDNAQERKITERQDSLWKH